jgi:hypothetical protein
MASWLGVWSDLLPFADAPGTVERMSGERSSRNPLGAGSLAADLVFDAAWLTAALARDEGNGPGAAQAGQIAERAESLSIANAAAFAAANEQLRAAAAGTSDWFLLKLALGNAASLPGAICEAAADLALLAADLARTGEAARRVDYIAIAELAAAAARASALLVRTNLTTTEEDIQVSATHAAVRLAAGAARSAAVTLD